MERRYQSNRQDPTQNEQGRLIQLSKTMSYLLRHGAEKEQLKISEDGYVLMEDLLSHRQCKRFTVEDVHWVVKNNDKQRFRIKEENEKEYIRANQGHSMKQVEVEMEPILDASKYPVVVHGTYFKNWNSIKKSGLCKMNRQHIHFAIGEYGSANVISGMRKTCEVVIYIDLETALKDGIKFFKSDNNVVLSEGINGYLLPKYFSCVLGTSNMLPFDLDFPSKR